MSKPVNSLKNFWNGGLDQDSAPEHIAVNDYLAAWNCRQSGTTAGEDGYTTNPESNLLLVGSLSPGINRCVGSFGFEQIRAGLFFVYNSQALNQIIRLDYDTNTLTVLFTNLTDSGGENILPLNPQHYVDDIKLINDTYALWNDAFNSIGYTNLNTLASGGYGTVLAEDFSLIKPQPMPPPTGEYGSDAGQPANYWFGNLPVFTAQYVNSDFNYSSWSTHSKRIVPYQQNTPSLGSDVSQNNYIIIGVDAGSVRASTLNIARQNNAETVFSIIKSVDRSYIVALPNTAVDVATEIFEAYDPATNIYYYVSYGNEVPITVPAIDTDSPYDYIPKSTGALEVVNGDIVALGDLRVGYTRPIVDVTVAAIGYNPNIAIPAGTYPDPLRKTGSFPGASGSGAGDHKRIMSISLGGTPHTGDKIIVVTADIRNASSTRPYDYEVTPSLDGDLAGLVAAMTPIFPDSSYVANGDGTYTITWTDIPYFGLQTYAIQLFFGGADVANSIPTVLDNSTYQLALSYRDKYGRFFPLVTNNSFILSTPSYAQISGQAVEITWAINNAAAPTDAVDYQWLLTKPPLDAMVDTLSTPLNFLGTWNAYSNTPTLAVNSGTVGDTYQVTTPASPGFGTPYFDLGNGSSYPTGSYVTYNGQSWDVLPKEFGDLTSTGSIIAFSLNPLNLFNSQYSQQGVDTVLGYDFVPGDRCTLHYYIDGGSPVYINDPCVNLSVFGYDAAAGIVKLEKPANFDESVLYGKNVFLRLYSPAQQAQSVSDIVNPTLYYEIGERYTITNGVHDLLRGVIIDGGVYYKTRQFDDGLMPYADPPVAVLATDLNYSDFYLSTYTSFGRPRTFNDELENAEREAVITWSQPYVLGSRRNGLTKFYAANVYGTAGGETSANYGAIVKLIQVNNELVCIQKLNHGSIPVWQTIYEDQLERATVAVSQKLFNPIRYTTSKHIGIGEAKESVAVYNNVIYWVDPNRSQPVRWENNGCFPISMKMSKYFKTTLQSAIAAGLKVIGWYDIFNDEYILSIQQIGGIVTTFRFDTSWRYLDTYTIAPADITITVAPTHSTPSYDTGTGLVTLTPVTDYIGGDTMQISFPVPGSGTVNKNVCFAWTAGNDAPNPFAFAPKDGQPLSTLIYSNTVVINGIDYPSPISIDSGEYCINDDGIWHSTAGTVNNGDTVQVRQTSSASYDTLTTINLTVGGFTSPFDVTTLSSTPPAGTYFSVLGGEGMTVIQVKNNSPAIGIPLSLNSISVPPGGRLDTDCGDLTTGNFTVRIIGTPNPDTFIKFRINGVLQDEDAVTTSGFFPLDYSVIDPSAVEYKVTLENGSG